MSEITLENVEPPPEVEEPHDSAKEEETAEEEQAEQVPAEVEEELAMPQDVESIVVKKPRGRPKGPPKTRPEPQKRGRPPMPPATAGGVESNPEPRPLTPYEAPVAWDMAAYNQSLINALVAHSQSTKVQRRAQWSSLVKL